MSEFHAGILDLKDLYISLQEILESWSPLGTSLKAPRSTADTDGLTFL